MPEKTGIATERRRPTPAAKPDPRADVLVVYGWDTGKRHEVERWVLLHTDPPIGPKVEDTVIAALGQYPTVQLASLSQGVQVQALEVARSLYPAEPKPPVAGVPDVYVVTREVRRRGRLQRQDGKLVVAFAHELHVLVRNNARKAALAASREAKRAAKAQAKQQAAAQGTGRRAELPAPQVYRLCRRCVAPIAHHYSQLQPDVAGWVCTTCLPRPTTALPRLPVTLTSPADLADILRHVQLVNWPLPILLSVFGYDPEADHQGMTVRATRWVMERDRGEAVEAISLHELPGTWCSGTPVTPQAIAAWVYDQVLRDVVLHELAEAFQVDGERPFDPHREDP